ncbi:Cytochrome P450 94A2 [Dichanthelium oligosanthes]|uniref:Cytochrome P450 94A2 n=1 Tax=Dichanthelium oligosanthes TaxID=888268 RepID=A0A1E5VE28_9POAL|nr:Cytochrome P450 94A2 [Dichanthelium oligosanthes]
MELSLFLTTWPHLLVLLIPLLLPLIFLFYSRQDPKKQPRADDLKAYPLLDKLPHLAKNQHRLVEWSIDVAKRSPTHTMVFKAFGLPGVVITANPNNVEHMTKTSFANYPKGELAISMLEDFLGHGIFNSDGDQWLWQRKAASYEFSKRSLRKFIVDTVRFEVVERLLPLLEQAAHHGSTLDMKHVLECFAFDNICHVAFGDDPACLAKEGVATPQVAEFIRAFDFVEDAILLRFSPLENFLWRLKRALNMAPEKQIRRALGIVHGYADRIVRKCREERGKEAGPESCRDDFLAHFAASGELSDESLRDVVTNFLLAGRDTTSSALTWFFWLVSGRPDVESKIVDEIRTVRSASGSGGGGGGSAGETTTFSLDELREMHYIHAAITESMRLYPPVPLGMHFCKQDDVLPDGTFVGKGWAVNHSVFAMARLEDIWGEDCEEFRPERWLREDGTFQPESPFKYPVFHAGPRMCLGKEMAYIQMKAIVSCAFERFSFRFLGGEERPGLDLSFTLRMRGGLPMQVTKRPGPEAV